MRTLSFSESLSVANQSTRTHTAEDKAIHKSVSHLSSNHSINVSDCGQGKECVISGLRREVDEICALLAYYAEKVLRVWNLSAACDRTWWRNCRKRGMVFGSLQQRSKECEVRI